MRTVSDEVIENEKENVKATRRRRLRVIFFKKMGHSRPLFLYFDFSIQLIAIKYSIKEFCQ